jgi:phosphate transport system substrate-binding protein
MKIITKVAIVLLVGAMLAGCAGTSATQPAAAQQDTNQPAAQPTEAKPEQKIAISGAFALYPMVVKWAEEYQKIYPNVIFDISGGGAGKGMADALAGAVDLGMVSREVSEEEIAQGAYGIAVARDAVFATVSAQNPYLADLQKTGITKETLAGIYLTGTITTWGQVLGKPEITDEIHAYTRSDACGAAEMWVKYMGGKKQEELQGIGVNADPGVLEAVIKDPLGIGYNNLNYAYDMSTNAPVAGAAVLPLDDNNNKVVDSDEEIATKKQAVDAVATGKYPSPPARPLYLVTKDAPSGAEAEFISWILNDGQTFVDEAGYVQLTPDQLAESKAKLK